MTLRAVSIKPGTISAEDLRAAFAAIMAPAGSDVSQTGYLPGAVATVTVSGLTVTASAFRGFIQGTATQGLYGVMSSSTSTKTLDAGGTQDRIDAIVARVQNDLYDSSGNNTFTIETIKGTEASAPVAPTLGATDLLIADVTVPAGASTGDGLTSDNVDTSRQPCLTEALGGIHVVSQNDPDGAYTGQWRDNAGVLERWSGSAWTRPGTELGYAENVSNTVSNISATNNTFTTYLTVTFSLPKSSAVQIAAHARVQAVTAGNRIRVNIGVDGSGQADDQKTHGTAGSTGQMDYWPSGRVVLAAGSHTIILQAARVSGSGSWDTIENSASRRTWLQAVYMGPA